MKLRYILPAIAFFVMSAVGSAQAGPVVYYGSDILLGDLSIGQTGIISNDYSRTPFLNNISGRIPSNSQVTFTYTLTGAAFGTLLVDLASYDYYDGEDNRYYGSAYSNSSGPSGSMGFFNESPSVPLVLATANLINPNSGVTRIQNFSGEYASFFSMITGLLTSMGGNVQAYFEVSAVPLPAALPLFGLGLAGLAGFGIRKRKKERNSVIKNSFIRFSCIAFAIAGFASAAYAAPVTVDLGWASYSISEGAVPVGNIDLQSLPADTGNLLANYSVSGVNLQLAGADIVTGNDKTGLFQHIKPSGVGNNQHYLAVFGLSPYLPGHAIFTLGSGITQFGFNWGSIDAYNFLTVTNGANKIYTISGADLIAAVNAINPGKTSRYFGLIDLAGITRIVLSSSWSAFEVADISVVPLPAALSLFGASLAGLIFVGRRKAKSKN